MIHSISANTRSDLRSATAASASTVSSIPLATPSAQTAQDIRLERLLFGTRPPIDAVSYTLPLKSVADKGCFAGVDARIAFLRKHGGAAPGEDIVQMVHEQHCRTLMVTRETVQDFFNDGACPRDHAELKALALFLLTNGLFEALTWLVARSGADTLDLHRCNLGNEGAGSVAKWARTLPFKVRLDLSNNCMEAAGAGLMAEVLEADTIFALDLGLNPLGDEGVQLVCTGLTKNTSVRSLHLSHVGADSAGMEAVAGVLDTHPSLVSLNLDANGYDDAAATVFAAALGYNKTLRSLSLHHADASDAGLSAIMGALRTNTSLLLMRASLAEPKHLQLPVMLAEVLALNQTLSDLEIFFGIITNAAAEKLASAVACNTALRTFKCRLSAYGLTKENAMAVKRIKDKVKANRIIEAAGNAVTALTHRHESAIAVPSEVGQVIAALVAQVAGDQRSLAAMQEVVQAGRTGPKNALA